MANFLRHWLEADERNTAVCIDASPLDAAATRFFEPVRGRLEFVQGSVSAPQTWQGLPGDIAQVVHGAAMTPHAYVDSGGVKREPEREEPLRVIETNIVGTARALEWARDLPELRRFVYVSTGSVYLDEVPAQRMTPFALPEEGYIGPHGLYDVTKYSGELITRRLGELYGYSTVSIRLSNVFGPMDRQTPFRNVRNPINIIARAAVEGRAVTAVNPDVPGDYIYAPDVAQAIRLLLDAPSAALGHDVYNIAYGAPARLRELLAYARLSAPGLALETASAGEADIKLDMDRSTGRWGAYDISRAARDFGWRPRPLGEAMTDYIAWLRDPASQ
jgi:UDP-glucose 4-epimerase